MNNNKSKKLIYCITSSVAVFILGFGIIIGTNRFNNNQVQNDTHYGISDLQDIPDYYEGKYVNNNGNDIIMKVIY